MLVGMFAELVSSIRFVTIRVLLSTVMAPLWFLWHGKALRLYVLFVGTAMGGFIITHLLGGEKVEKRIEIF